MIRVPAVLVGLVCACVLAICAFWAAQVQHDGRMLAASLPLITWLAGFIGSRWSLRPAPIPGLAIGVLALAIRAGLGIGVHDDMLFYIEPTVALLELIAAISGGVVGTLLARRASPKLAPKADWGTFS